MDNFIGTNKTVRKNFDENYSNFIKGIQEKSIEELKYEKIFYASNDNVVSHPIVILSVFLTAIGFVSNSNNNYMVFILVILVLIMLGLLLLMNNNKNQNNLNKMKVLILEDKIKELEKKNK